MDIRQHAPIPNNRHSIWLKQKIKEKKEKEKDEEKDSIRSIMRLVGLQLIMLETLAFNWICIKNEQESE